ncbi:MAG TPA: hypothetical protein VKA49_16860 [Flavitalea sp.]|nr:hypothetical protein [Flavitalea sp.]
MKKIISPAVLFFSILFSACSPLTPEKYFDVAVLNSNFLVGFAENGQLRELQSPSMKMSEKDGKVVVMNRSEAIDTKIQFVETTLAKLKTLKITEDSKEILEASRPLYEYVLPVYKKEYRELAMLYDKNAPKEKLDAQAELIRNKYYTRYEELHTRLVNAGKSYARKHNIEVNWGM